MAETNQEGLPDDESEKPKEKETDKTESEGVDAPENSTEKLEAPDKLERIGESDDFKNAPKIKEVDISAVEADIRNALVIYDTMAQQLRQLLVLLGVLAIGLSLFVSTFIGTKIIEPLPITIISYVSTLCLSLISYFGIAGKGNNSRNAWRHLNYAHSLYLAGIINIAYLIKSYAEAEAMLGETNFTYQVPTK